MSPKAVRTALWITGIISGLVLLLYLPVLIWSPPWGDNGYYLPEKDPNFANISFGVFNDGIMLAYMTDGNGGLDKGTATYERDGGNWTRTERQHELADYKFDMSFENNEMVVNIQLISEGKVLKEAVNRLPKVSNPFTLWYFKWLEWTN